MKREFDLSYKQDIIDGKVEVVTDCGEPVEIVKWNCKGNYPILAVIDDGDTSDTCFYDEEGLSPSKKERIYVLTDEPESEDERIRKEIIEFVKSRGGFKQEYIAWLEKQGEKGIVLRDTFGYEEGRQKGQEEGIMLVLDNPQKYGLEKQGEHKFPSLSEKEIVCCKRILDFLREEHNSYTGKDFANEIAVLEWLITHPVLIHSSELQQNQGEQKPAEDDDREYACQSPENYTRRELMIYNLGIINGKKMFEDNIKEDQQKAVWSEEDEKMLVGCVQAMCTPDAYSLNDRINFEYWLKSFKDRVYPQPKQEWSEEDERCRKALLYLLEHYSILTSERESCIVWLKSLRPQNTWKPSDEQMRVLDLAIRCGINRGTTEETTLVSLFNDLKKLK